jgi:hypothetical protein
VQSCQAAGRRVLLSIKADGLDAVGGNADFGESTSDEEPWGGPYGPSRRPSNANDTAGPPAPNLFDQQHVPSAFAQTMFSLFGEGRTERADLRPLGPDTPEDDGVDWVTRPLGEEVVVDGFDVQVPSDWEGKYQDDKFHDLVERMQELNNEAWTASGAVKGGPGDLGADGKGVVYFGWQGERSKRAKATFLVGGFEVEVRY